MHIIAYERRDRDFFCPVTAQPVHDDMGLPVAPSFRALWVGEVMDEPTTFDAELQSARDAYVAKVQHTEEWIESEHFLRLEAMAVFTIS
jgi:hypothetical protein